MRRLAALPSWAVELIAVVLPVAMLLGLWWLLLLAWRLKRVPRLVRETIDPEALALDRRWLQSGWAAIAFAFVSMAAENVLLRGGVSQGLRTVAILAPVIPLVWFVISWRREVQRGEELDRRIHLEALTFAFPTYLIMMSGLRFLHEVRWPVPPPSMSWHWMPMLYGLGVWIFKWHFGGEVLAQGRREERERPSEGGDS